MTGGRTRLLLVLLLALPLLAGPARADSRQEQLDAAWAAFQAGDNARARELFGSLAAEGDVEAHFGLGLMDANGLGASRDDAAAASHFSKAAEGGYAAAQDALGYMYDFGLGLPLNHDLAEYWYRKAVDGGDLNAKNNLAYSWISSGRRLDEALDLLQQVMAASPGVAAYLDSYGWALYRLGRLREALPPLCEAARRDPGHPEVQAHLGDALWRVGRKAEARQQWQRALELAEQPSLLSQDGVDFLHGVGIEGWRAELTDRLARGLGDTSPAAGSTAGEDTPLDDACQAPIS
jgi:TPR repeat protein